MKILTFSDIALLESPFQKLQSIVESEKIDLVILLGGLFPKPKQTDKNEDIKKPKVKKIKEERSINILELNWLLIPIITIPDLEDLKMKDLISQIQAQDAIWIRYIHNKGTIIDSWFFFSVTDSESEEYESLRKNIENYSKLSPDRSVLLYVGVRKLQFPSVDFIFLPNKANIPNISAFIVSVDSIKEGTVTIVDLDKKTVNSLLVQ
jgi:hypothetical protein